MKKRLLIPLIPLILIGVVITRFTIDKQIDYVVSTDNIIVPTFNSLELDFDQKLKDSESLPFTASAVIDIDNNGTEELFIGGGPNQLDAIFTFKNKKFIRLSENIISKPKLTDATFASIVLDVDNNGFSDLIITRTSGVWLYLNTQGTFTEKLLDIPFNDNTTPLSVAISDINRDGYFDLYVAGYIKKEKVEGQNLFNKEGYGGTSLLLLNNGDNSFTDITKSSGIYYTHNTFMGIFIDIDNDQLEDLVVAHDTGHVKTWKNTGNNQFIDMPNPNSNEYSYPMGIAVTDYKNNNSADLFFSNVGSTPPEFVVRGDLREDQLFNPKWILFENQGNFSFKDIAVETKLADYEFSWGAIFEDFNLDGRDDLVVSENYIGFPPHNIPFLRLPGRFLVQTETGEFAPTGAQSGVINTGYGISPITADFNNDGYPDVVHINIAGKSKAFINKGGNSNYLKIKLPDTLKSIAAKIKVTKVNGDVIYRDFVSGEGLNSDQSHIQIFGLENTHATEVSVQYINGDKAVKTGKYLNTTLTF